MPSTTLKAWVIDLWHVENSDAATAARQRAEQSSKFVRELFEAAKRQAGEEQDG